jgi:hypothetical protein
MMDDIYKGQTFCDADECLEISCQHHQQRIDVIEYEQSGKRLSIKDYRKDCEDYTPPVFNLYDVFEVGYICEDCTHGFYEADLEDEPRGRGCRVLEDSLDETECPEYFICGKEK